MRNVSKIAQEEGIRNPVFLSQSVYEFCVRPNANCEDTEERLREFLSVLRFEMDQANGTRKNRRLFFEFDAQKPQNQNQRRSVLEIIAGRWNPVTQVPPVSVVFPDEKDGREGKALPDERNDFELI